MSAQEQLVLLSQQDGIEQFETRLKQSEYYPLAC